MCIFSICCIACTKSFSSENSPSLNTEQEINALMVNWCENFNAKNANGVCSLFAPDLVAAYPGIEDKNYNKMCQTLTTILSQSEETFTYAPPQIEQMIVDKDTVVVRVKWKLNVTYKDSTETDSFIEKGLDIFERQPDGSWKIAISYAYPEDFN